MHSYALGMHFTALGSELATYQKKKTASKQVRECVPPLMSVLKYSRERSFQHKNLALACIIYFMLELIVL